MAIADLTLVADLTKNNLQQPGWTVGDIVYGPENQAAVTAVTPDGSTITAIMVYVRSNYTAEMLTGEESNGL